MIIEWNVHLFSSDTDRYPFHPRAAYAPNAAMLSADPLADYLAHMAEQGIDRAVIVHPEPYGDDHRLILEVLAKEPDRFRGTSLFYPRDADAPQKLRDLVAQEPRSFPPVFMHTGASRSIWRAFPNPASWPCGRPPRIWG